MNLAGRDDLSFLAAVAAHAAAGVTGPAPGVLHDDIAAWAAGIDVCPDRGADPATVLGELGAAVAARSVDPHDPRCVAHLHCATLPVAAAAEVVIGSLNQSMDSYDQAPAATHLEDRLMRWLAGELGFGAGSGVMTAGGTASNIAALTLARARHCERVGVDVRRDGLPADASRWRILTSAGAHFSVDRAATLLGLGTNAVVRVPTGTRGRMDVDALDASIAACEADGNTVLAVVATAGTTDCGAVDPIAAIVDAGRRSGAWIHVDAAVGSAFVLSETLKGRLAGIGGADSVTCDFHKLWFLPISCSALVVADAANFALLDEYHDYLNRPEDAEEGVLNLVDRSLDTSRRFDAFKVLVALRSVGRARYAAAVEHCVEVAADIGRHIDAHPEFELLAPVDTVTVLFRWRGGGVDVDELDGVNTAVARALFDAGVAVLGRTRIDGHVALKFTIVNPDASSTALVDCLATISQQARRLTGR